MAKKLTIGLGGGGIPASIRGALSKSSSLRGRIISGTLVEQSSVEKIEKRQLSQYSDSIMLETLFDDFNLTASPVYNFWVSDEDVNDDDDVGDRKLDDVPRYIRVTWNPAPDIRDDDEKVSMHSVGKSKRRSMEPVKFASQLSDKGSFFSRGLSFSPEHLSNFSLIKRSVANGYISPGTMNSVVEIHADNADIDDGAEMSRLDGLCHIDEDSFLTHPEMAGISFHELKSSIRDSVGGVGGSERSFAKAIGRSTSLGNDFSVNTLNGEISIDDVSPLTPGMSIKARVVSQRKDGRVDIMTSVASKVAETSALIPKSISRSVKVKFVDTGIGGAVSQDRVESMRKPEHAESIVAVSQFMENLVSISHTRLTPPGFTPRIPSFSSPAGLRRVEYVGYVLEKYELDENGSFDLIDEIDLPSREYTEYVDSKVKYGTVYRYRIKSLVRWTHSANVNVNGVEQFMVERSGSQTAGIAPYVSSYFAGGWSANWAYAATIDTSPPPCPDEIVVRPESHKKQIVVTFKLPFNPQRDISAMRLYRRIRNADGENVTDWEVVGDFPPQNSLFVDDDVDFFQSSGEEYVYAAQCVSRHDERSELSDQIGARLNEDYKLGGEFLSTFVSQSGVMTWYRGMFSTYPIKRFLGEVLTKDRVVLSGRSAVGKDPMNDVDYIVRVESLDTGAIYDVNVAISYVWDESLVDRIDTNIFVQNSMPTSVVVKRMDRKVALAKTKTAVVGRGTNFLRRP